MKLKKFIQMEVPIKATLINKEKDMALVHSSGLMVLSITESG